MKQSREYKSILWLILLSLPCNKSLYYSNMGVRYKQQAYIGSIQRSSEQHYNSNCKARYLFTSTKHSRPIIYSLQQLNSQKVSSHIPLHRKWSNYWQSISKKLTELKFVGSYVWPEGNDSIRLKVFLVIAMVFMYLGKWFSLKVPFILQSTIDSLSSLTPSSTLQARAGIKSALIFYGLSRAMSVVCSEIKTCLFSHVSNNVLRKFANQCFGHLHKLDGDFHLTTPSGVLSVSYVRAVRGFQTILFQIVFSVIPTALELFMVCRVMYRRFSPVFAAVTMSTFSLYLAFTVWVTQWRVKLRQDLVDTDNARNGFFIDSMLNHEVVKLFSNEQRESQRFDSYLSRIQRLSIDSTYAIGLLNLGQAALFCGGLTTSLLLAFAKVQAGSMSVGDLVAVNSMLLHLSVPFNFMGYTYQEIQQSLVDMGFMTNVLKNQKPAITESSTARDLDELTQPRHLLGPSSLEFRDVCFSYNANNSSTNSSNIRSGVDSPLLNNISFKIEKGQNVAIVGPSGSGKSTTLKLITRMLDASSGSILLDGVDIRNATLTSLRRRVAVVPQDTCLFDESIRYNILYGAQGGQASEQQLQRAVTSSNLQATIAKLQQAPLESKQKEALNGDEWTQQQLDSRKVGGVGLDTVVGERGARLSGGERQKVAIARAILRDPSLILCDEVTSSVDAFAERDIVQTLRSAARNRTTITVAHRLSSVVHCDNILVIDKGVLVEKGTHRELLRIPGGVYRNMWSTQNNLSTSTASLEEPSSLLPPPESLSSPWLATNISSSFDAMEQEFVEGMDVDALTW